MALSLRKRPAVRDRFAEIKDAPLTMPIVHDPRDRRAVTELDSVQLPSGKAIRYVLIDRRYYRVDPKPTSDLRAGHYLATADHDAFLPLAEISVDEYQRAKLLAEAPGPTPTPRPVDVLATMLSLRGRPDWFAPVSAAPQAADAAVVAGPMTDVKPHGYVAGKPRVRSFRDALGLYEARATLSVVGGRLRVDTARPLSIDDRNALRQLEPAFVALLSGKPLVCAYCPAEATTMLFVAVPVCPEHAG